MLPKIKFNIGDIVLSKTNPNIVGRITRITINEEKLNDKHLFVHLTLANSNGSAGTSLNQENAIRLLKETELE